MLMILLGGDERGEERRVWLKISKMKSYSLFAVSFFSQSRQVLRYIFLSSIFFFFFILIIKKKKKNLQNYPTAKENILNHTTHVRLDNTNI